MATQRLHAAMAPIDVLTRSELSEELHKAEEGRIREFYRGVDYHEINGNGDGAAFVVVPGPESGYAWSVKIVSFTVGTASQQVYLYLGESNASSPIGTTTASATANGNSYYAAVFVYTSNVVVLKDGRSLYIEAPSGAIYNWKVIAKQVPSEMIGKL